MTKGISMVDPPYEQVDTDTIDIENDSFVHSVDMIYIYIWTQYILTAVLGINITTN